MRSLRLIIATLVFTGFGLVTLGLLLIAGDITAYAQDESEQAEYIGSRECGSCHRGETRAHQETAHGLAFQDVERDKDPILGDFSLGEELRTVQFPGDDAPRPFTADDIAYAVGAGQRVQRYVFEVSRDELLVLPAEWNAEAGIWQPVTLAESWPDPAYDWTQNCAYCHVTAFDAEEGRWEEEGVQCETCHGPGSEHASLADDAGRNPDEQELIELRAAINLGIDPQVCGQCHARGTGTDNRPFPIDFRPGADLSASFTLFPPDDAAHWYASGHASQANMQYSEWLESGHSRALTNLLESGEEVASECLACHSADYAYTQRLIAAVEAEDREGPAPQMPTAETARFGVACASCHNPHLETDQPANLIQETYALCTGCHNTANFNGEGVHHPVQEMFEGLQIIPEVSSRPSDHFLNEEGPTCQTCHFYEAPVENITRASHSLAPMLPGQAANLEGVIDSCTGCHEDQVDAAAMQRLIDDIQQDARTRIETARAAVNAATPEWVIQVLDFVEGDGSYGVHNYAYADELLDAVFAQMELFEAVEQ